MKNIDELLNKLSEEGKTRLTFQQAMDLSHEYGDENIDRLKKELDELAAERDAYKREALAKEHEIVIKEVEFTELIQKIHDNEQAIAKSLKKEAFAGTGYEATPEQERLEKEYKKKGFRFDQWIAPEYASGDEEHGVMKLVKGKEIVLIDPDGTIG